MERCLPTLIESVPWEKTSLYMGMSRGYRPELGLSLPAPRGAECVYTRHGPGQRRPECVYSQHGPGTCTVSPEGAELGSPQTVRNQVGLPGCTAGKPTTTMTLGGHRTSGLF